MRHARKDLDFAVAKVWCRAFDEFGGNIPVQFTDEVQLDDASRQWTLVSRVQRLLEWRVAMHFGPGAVVEITCQGDNPVHTFNASG
jgi:hypothetical protein